MKKSLLYFSILIIVLNFLFFLIGFTNNIGFVGAFMGGLMAISTDPIIIVMAILIGTVLVNLQSRFSVIFFILAAVVGAIVVHFILGTTKFIVDVVRVDALLIIPALIIIIASFFTPKIKPTKKTKAIKLPKLPKLWWVVFPVVAFIFLIFYGVTNYESKVVEDEPRWMVCKPNRDFWVTPKPLYIKFHNTIKTNYDLVKQEWVRSEYVKEVTPTIEIHEDRTRFTDVIYGYKKIFPIYVSDKYYVFYKEINDGWFWGGDNPKTSAQHIILTRSDLTLLEYNNQWVKGFGLNKKYNDYVIDELFREVNEYPKNSSFNLREENTTEEIPTFDGGTFKAKRKLYTYQCEEIAAIKPKI